MRSVLRKFIRCIRYNAVLIPLCVSDTYPRFLFVSLSLSLSLSLFLHLQSFVSSDKDSRGKR